MFILFVLSSSFSRSVCIHIIALGSLSKTGCLHDTHTRRAFEQYFSSLVYGAKEMIPLYKAYTLSSPSLGYVCLTAHSLDHSSGPSRTANDLPYRHKGHTNRPARGLRGRGQYRARVSAGHTLDADLFNTLYCELQPVIAPAPRIITPPERK